MTQQPGGGTGAMHAAGVAPTAVMPQQPQQVGHHPAPMHAPPTQAPTGGAPAPTAGIAQHPAPAPMPHQVPMHAQAQAPHHQPPAAAQPAAAAQTVCGRCRGVNPGNTRYCQFCGALLAPQQTAQAPQPQQPAYGGAPYGVPPQAAPLAQPAVMQRPMTAQAPAQRPDYGSGPGMAAATVHARFVVITQDGSPGRHYELTEPQSDIGREEGSILLPNDPYVSPRHARLYQRNGQFFIRDLGSVNGIYVRLRGPKKLQHGDLVLIGLEVLRFELVTDAEKSLGVAVERGTQVFGSPATTRYARLCQRTVEGVTRDIYSVTRDETIIGRESGDIVFTADPFMSRQHAVLSRDPADDAFTIRDLGSSNGTYVAIRGETELQAGDHVRIGQHLFRLEMGPS